MQFTTGTIALAAALFSAASANPIVDINSEPVESAEIVERAAVHPSYATDADFQRTILGGHDAFRRQHGITVPMTWNSQRASDATAYAKQCKLAHSGAKGAGENLAMGYPDAAAVVTAWATERMKYNYNAPGFSSATGHFTQVVWKKTGTVGCGKANCGSKGWLVVCQYVAPGNVLPASNFAANVPRQIKGSPSDRYLYRPASKVKRDAAAEAEVPLVAPIKVAGVEE